MKHLFFLFCLSAGVTCYVNAQVVNIPDANFKAYLVGNLAINTNGDGDIQVSEATAFTGPINCYTKNIADLRGIEAFVNLKGLYCGDNPLTGIDLSNNTALEILSCYNDGLSSLDVSHNIALKELYCWDNQLGSLDVQSNLALLQLACNGNQLVNLDVSHNTYLTTLSCSSNKLIGLDVSKDTALTSLDCNDNQLTSLNLKNGNNAAMKTVDMQNNPNLMCIQVDDAAKADAYTAATYWQKDTTANYNENCMLSVSKSEKLQSSIYPNPVKELLNFPEEMLNVGIADMSGKFVQQVAAGKSVDVSTLAKGVYMVAATTKTGKIIKQRFTKE